MGLCASVYIFQTKIDELLGYIEGVKTYIYEILVLSKDRFSKHIEQKRMIFGRLRAAGLKVNSPKWSFGLNNIPYMGYVIKKEGIKPDHKKVKGIMDIRRTNTSSFKELKCMVSAETLLSYPYWTIPFTVHTYASEK